MSCWCNGACPNVVKAKSFLEKRQHARAELELRRALTRAPDCPQANAMLAGALGSTNRAAFAVTHLERALKGDFPAAALAVAVNLRQQAKGAEAVEAYKTALIFNPDNVHAFAGLVGALEAVGDLDGAQAELDRVASSSWSISPQVRRVAGVVAAARKDYARAVELLSVDDLLPIELLDRGRYREKLGQYPEAWSDWMTAKSILREKHGHEYDRERMAQSAAALREIAEPARARFVHAAEPLTGWPRPIFVTGFPRSGTTMIEAALSAHSRVVAGDELMGIGEVVRMLPRLLRAGVPYPLALMATSQGENTVFPGLLRDFYVRKAVERIAARIGAPFPSAGKSAGIGPLGKGRFFTDKMPLNEMHAPLIWCLFPDAPILNVRRHPLDVVVSNMSHFLVHGGFYASSPDAAASHYALVADTLDHYKKAGLFSARKFVTVRYEKFVADHEAEIDATLTACGLRPEAACYNFHLNEWQSRTISYRQIKQPVNDSSVGRYKPFLEFLAPIVPTLRHVIEREGYDQ